VEIADAVVDRSDLAGIRTYIADALLLKGHALAAAERTPEAERVLREARSTAESLGHRRILWEILVTLGGIVGHEERAGMRTEARAIVEDIAANLDPDFKEGFQQRPDVRALLG
jgi:hypothetical protein